MMDNAQFHYKHPLVCAFALALGAAISLGISRFGYTLFLPLMMDDLQWNYFVSGSMNTANAIGYLVGALTFNEVGKRARLHQIFLWATFATVVLIALTGCWTTVNSIFLMRFLVGLTSTWVFVSGGALAANVGIRHAQKSGLILGIYYGGVGFGIVLSSLLVREIENTARVFGYSHPWQYAWWGMALVALLFWIILYLPVKTLRFPIILAHAQERISLRETLPMNLGYFLYGIGYIGYMTFSVALVREIGLAGKELDFFYGLLGLLVMLSSRIWSKKLDQKKDGAVLGWVNLVLAVACFIPIGIALFGNSAGIQTWQVMLMYLSATLFGSSVVTAVSATTAFVKHNFPQEDWIYGIRLFTIIFAIGQIIGPTMVGYLSDITGSLGVGLLFSGIVLLLGSYVAFLQRPIKKLHD